MHVRAEIEGFFQGVHDVRVVPRAWTMMMSDEMHTEGVAYTYGSVVLKRLMKSPCCADDGSAGSYGKGAWVMHGEHHGEGQYLGSTWKSRSEVCNFAACSLRL